METLEEFYNNWKNIFKNWSIIRDNNTNEITNIYWEHNNILYSITAPHEGNNFSYMLRINPKMTFDRWHTADIEEFYDDVESVNYDIQFNDWVYKRLMWIYVERYAEDLEN